MPNETWKEEFDKCCRDNGIYDASPLYDFMCRQIDAAVSAKVEEVRAEIVKTKFSVKAATWTDERYYNDAADEILDLPSLSKSIIK